jgi:hypothetical protein
VCVAAWLDGRFILWKPNPRLTSTAPSRPGAKTSRTLAAKLIGRSSFALCCVAASLLALLLYAFVAFCIPAGWYKFSGMATIAIVDESRTFILPLRLIGFAILTLFLARKQFVPEKA